jgi:hypothetical protein
MSEIDVVDAIQKEIREIQIAAANCDPDEWLMDHIDKIQWIINDFRNQEFKHSEPDPFN